MFHGLGDDHQHNVEGIVIVSVKMFDGIIRELKEVRYIPQLKKKSYLILCFRNVESCGIYTRWCSQDDQRLNGGYERRPPE